MTEPFFPADVSLRIDGELEDAQALFPAARNLLFRALRRKEISGAADVRQFHPGTDGSLIHVVLSGNLKHLYVRPGPRKVGKEVLEEEELEIEPINFFPYSMYSGAVRPPSSGGTEPMVIAEEGELRLDQFHPDSVCAAAYSLEMTWQKPPKLAINEGNLHSNGTARSFDPKPGHYSGAMKRVVQALYGIGWTETDTEGFISEELPDTYPDYATPNLFNYVWEETHGIYKGDDGVWLIEVSKDRGVLAMQLPIFKGTDSPLFESFISDAGDIDTLNVILEFGGLPTGESFPTGADLTAAIASGKVLQLLTDVEMLDFYHDLDPGAGVDTPTAGLFPSCGWAFSESGRFADNTAVYLRRPDIVNVSDVVFQSNSDGQDNAAIDLRYTIAKWWRLTFSLTTAFTDAQPYGNGTVALELVESNLVWNQLRIEPTPFILSPQWVALCMVPGPGSTTDLVGKRNFHCRPKNFAPIDPTKGPDDERAAIFVFYDGETPEVVRYIPFGDFLFCPAHFVGDSLDLGWANRVIGLNGVNCQGIAFPTGCREGYVLMLHDFSGYVVPGWDPSLDSLISSYYPITMSGYFAQIGRVDFTPVNELMYSDVQALLNIYGFMTFPWKYTTVITYQFHVETRCAAVINAGPTRGYVMTDGVLVSQNQSHDDPGFGGGTLVIRPSTEGTYVQPGEINELEIPVDAAPMEVTFVGSP